ncbi:MAG: ATP-dependent Clp protease adaptor ClpS [Treponema sp.]|nr:ATP-dependent Clp protease adaptor ClpS [Treponema sp.]
MSENTEPYVNLNSGAAENTTIELPPERSVVFYNDDYTTMEFVVDVLCSVFNYSKDESEQIMRTVHEMGSAVVGTYTYDIAVSRVILTRSIAKKNGFPLRVEVE